MRVLQLDHAPRCVAYSPFGSLLAVGGLDGVSLFSLPEFELADRLFVDGQGIETLAFSPTGEVLAAGGEQDVIFWDGTPGVMKRRELGRVQGNRGGTTALAWSPHEIRGVAATGWDRSLRWISMLPISATSALTTTEPIAALVAQPDGLLLAGGGWRCVHFWEWSAILKMWRPLPPVDVGMPIRAMAASPDGKLLVAGYGDGRLSLWDFDQRKWIGEMAGHEWVIYGLGFTPDGRRLVSGSADGTVRLWDVPNRHQIATYRFHKSWVTCVAVAPDGMTAACGGDDATLVLWDLDDA